MKSKDKYLKEYQKYIEEDELKAESEKEVLAYLLEVLLRLWYNPTESLVDFKTWFRKRISKYDITWQQLIHCIDNFDDYWSNPEVKKIVNYKTTFFNNPHLRKYLKMWYEWNVNINNM